MLFALRPTYSFIKKRSRFEKSATAQTGVTDRILPFIIPPRFLSVPLMIPQRKGKVKTIIRFAGRRKKLPEGSFYTVFLFFPPSAAKARPLAAAAPTSEATRARKIPSTRFEEGALNKVFKIIATLRATNT